MNRLIISCESCFNTSMIFNFTSHTASAFSTTLCVYGMLIDDLLSEDYPYMNTARFQRDLIE